MGIIEILVYDTPTLFFLAGFAFIGLSMVKIEKDDSGRISKFCFTNPKKLPLIFGISFLLIGFYLLVPDKPDDSGPEITITYPSEASKVDLTERVEGTAENVPDNKDIWIVAYNHYDYNYYPLGKAIISSVGTWKSVDPLPIGNEEDEGYSFDIHAVLADENAQETLSECLKYYRNNAVWSELKTLPDGAKICYTVTVERKVIPEIHITYPSEESTVEMEEHIKGTAKNVPEYLKIWIVVHPLDDSRYYPFGEAMISKGNWSSGGSVPIGTEENVDSRFDIYVVLADESAQRELKKYHDNCMITKEWEGITELPAGTEIFSRVTVSRK